MSRCDHSEAPSMLLKKHFKGFSYLNLRDITLISGVMRILGFIGSQVEKC